MDLYDKIIDFTNSNSGGGGGSVSTALLSYPTGGEALSDTTLYNYIKGMYDSVNITRMDTNYTISGNPTLSDFGVLSGLTSGQNIQLKFDDETFAQKANAASTWSVVIKFKVAEGEGGCLFGGAYGTYLPYISYNNQFRISLESASSYNNYDIADYIGGTYVVPNDTDVWVKLSFTGSKYILAVSTDGETYTTDIEITNSNKINPDNRHNSIGAVSSTDQLFKGTIYLNDIVFIFDEDIYKGFYIPCKKIKTGSKVVDVTYKASVDKLYNDTGVAFYYVIDTTNETIRLPMGDIFSFIAQNN